MESKQKEGKQTFLKQLVRSDALGNISDEHYEKYMNPIRYSSEPRFWELKEASKKAEFDRWMDRIDRNQREETAFLLTTG